MSESIPAAGGLRPPPSRIDRPGARELFVRYARKEGRTVAMLRAVDYGDSCVVEAEVFPPGESTNEPRRPGPYTFAGVQQANGIVTEVLEALMVLGCAV
jgi:hypothetical protein